MGMFDSIFVTCPECGNEVEFQSKAGECYLGTYNLQNAPFPVLADCIGKSEVCEQCGTLIEINGTVQTWINTWKTN